MNDLNIKQCTVVLTRACNLRCNFCFAKRAGYNKKNTISFENLKKIVDFCNDLEVKYLFFTGGEPLLYPQFIDILQYIQGFAERIYRGGKSRRRRQFPYFVANRLAACAQHAIYRGADYVYRLLERLSSAACIYAYAPDRGVRTVLFGEYGQCGQSSIHDTHAYGGFDHDACSNDYTVSVFS